MKHLIRTFACAAAVSSALVSQAAVNITTGSTTNNWQGTPNYFNYNGTGAATAINRNPGGAFVAEGNFGTGGAGGNGSLLNTFALSTGGQLTSIQLLLSGGPSTFNLTLYNMGGGYTQSAASIDPTTLTVAYSTTGISYAPGSGAQNVTVLDFTGIDQVTLAAGNYGLAITPTTTALQWGRGGADTFAGDMLYRWDGTSLYAPINGSGAPYRHAAFAVTVPEPSSMALLGIGALAIIQFIRRKQS